MRRRSVPMIGRQSGISTALGLRIPMASLIQTLAVAEYLNFRHAANALGVAQSSVSARVKALQRLVSSPKAQFRWRNPEVNPYIFWIESRSTVTSRYHDVAMAMSQA